MSKIIIKFHSLVFGRIDIYAYQIFELSDWKTIKDKLRESNESLEFSIGKEHFMKGDVLYFDRGLDFLEFCEEQKITDLEYEIFCNYMLTYFGETSVFEDLEKST